MERLSNKAIDIVNELHTERLDYQSEYLPLIDALNKLAAYEDTGYSPADFDRLCKGMDETMRTATELMAFERLNELAQADKDGRLLVLPCKVGDTVYQIDFGYNEKETVRGYSVYMHTNLYNFRPSSIGKTVFFTHEEAEAALK